MILTQCGVSGLLPTPPQFVELNKLLGAKWKSLTDAQKQPYEVQAELDKRRYAQEMKEANAVEIQRQTAPHQQQYHQQPQINLTPLAASMSMQSSASSSSVWRDTYHNDQFYETAPTRPQPQAKQQTNKRKKKDPNAPKRPRTAYIFFTTAIREQTKRERPDVTSVSTCNHE